MKINGKEHKSVESGTVATVLKQLNLQKERLVVEVNGDIVPKGRYDDYWIDKAAIVEIVSFVGGG